MILKNTTTTLVLVLLAGNVMAYQNDFPKQCPSQPSQKTIAKKETSQTDAQSAANKLVAEARSAMRSSSRENVAKPIALAEQALKSDPDNTAAYLVLARAHSRLPQKISFLLRAGRCRSRFHNAFFPSGS